MASIFGIPAGPNGNPNDSVGDELYTDCILDRGPGTRNSDCQICMVDFEADDWTITHTPCNNTFHRSCFDTWASTRTEDGRDVTCPKCRAVLRPANDSTTDSDEGLSDNDANQANDPDGSDNNDDSDADQPSDSDGSDDDDDNDANQPNGSDGSNDSDLNSQASEGFIGWGPEPLGDGARATQIRLTHLPDLWEMRTYDSPELATRNGHTYEIPPDMFHHAICQELPRRSDVWAQDGNSHLDPNGQAPTTVSELHMDDQSWDRFLYQTRAWRVRKYQCYWAPPHWHGVDFFLVPEYQGNSNYNSEWRGLRDLIQRVVRLEGLNAGIRSRYRETWDGQ